MKSFLFLLAFLPAIALAEPNWLKTVTPVRPGPFPQPKPTKAVYRFGWSGLPAGRAKMHFEKPASDRFEIEVRASTTGVVRALWKIDATHFASANASTLHPIQLKQVEKYSNERITSEVIFGKNTLSRLRSVTPADPNPPKWKRFSCPDVLDLHSAVLFVRSQRLQAGDTVRFVVYPAADAYLVTLTVLGQERVTVSAGTFDTLKLEARVLSVSKDLQLGEHSKFKRALFWVSNDADRLLVKGRADIFVGSVFMELESRK